MLVLNAALSGGQSIDDEYVTAVTALSAQFAAVLDRIEAQDQLAAKDRKIASLVDDCPLMMMTLDRDMKAMAWPVPGTLMVEPTESEPKAELDRFIAAMLGIAAEAEAIAAGQLDAEDNPLKRAPHTVEDLVGDWNRGYDREAACFPAGAFRVDKYWSPVNRVDNAYGDRNLVCSCPPMETYTDVTE